MLLTTIIGYSYIVKNAPNFLCSKTLGIIGKSILLIDIASFFISVILGEYLAYKLMLSNFKCNNIIAIIILIIILMCFVIFTYHTPKIEIFRDSVTNQYRIIKDIGN